MSDRPETLGQLRLHLRRMALTHHEMWLDKRKDEHRRHDHQAMSTAYHGAADELDQVLDGLVDRLSLAASMNIVGTTAPMVEAHDVWTALRSEIGRQADDLASETA